MQFICFYTRNPVCACKIINEEEIARADSFQKLSKLLDEIVFETINDEFLIQVQRDGQIRFHSKTIEIDHPKEYSEFNRSVNWEQKWGKYLELINAFHLILYSSVLQFKWGGDRSCDFIDFYEITRNDAFPDDDNGMRIIISHGFDLGQIRRAQYRQNQYVSHPLLDQHLGLHTDILNNAVQTFSTISNKSVIIRLLSEMAKSLAEFKQFNNTSSLIFSWFGTEKILNRMWDDLRKSDDFSTYKLEIDNANKDDKECIVPIRKYTVANKIVGLNVAKRISEDDKSKLTICRQERNDIAHNNNNRASEDSSKTCLKLFIKLLNKYYDLNIYLSFDSSSVVI
ncbi:hypothetical protein H4J57_18805 [Colwellia sp. BRX8-7]|uniref:hypothetical protein n=1 Tax=Colwellia sp. BRX8-7 TaxID=2759833 RepID=UPI0015F597D5|nr:hypothetical protein [Colwellia sp. BRX8-7]MBA6339240.1 hypothetical protein [Colwellia sp. BRX8-7]